MDGSQENGERAAEYPSSRASDSAASHPSTGRASPSDPDAEPHDGSSEAGPPPCDTEQHDARLAGPPPLADPYRLQGRMLCERYRVEEPIGQGGMALVFRGRDVQDDREVAIKVLRPGMRERPDAVTRFLREARITSRVRHEHVIRVTDYGHSEEGVVFSVMEYLDGEDLGATLEREGPLPWPRVRRLALQVCEALQAVHEAGVVHRDLKPRNCFLTRAGGPQEFVKILDFGIAKLAYSAEDVEQDLTAEGAIFGTPEYIAPEQAKNAEDVDERADIYAVGVLLYQLSCGRPPFRAKSPMVTLAMHIYEECEPPRRLVPELPARLEDVILRALRKNPDERYQTMAHLCAALEAIDGEASDAHALRDVELDTRSMRRAEGRVLRGLRPGFIALGSAMLVMVAAVAFTLADPSILEKREALTTTTESVMPSTLAGMHARPHARTVSDAEEVPARAHAAEHTDEPAVTVVPLLIPPPPPEPFAAEPPAEGAKVRPAQTERDERSRTASKKRSAKRRRPTKQRPHDEVHAALPKPPDAEEEVPEVPLQSLLDGSTPGNASDRPLPEPGPGRSFRIIPPATPSPFLPLRNHTWRDN